MKLLRKVAVFGDSILKGIQINPADKRYRVDNHIDMPGIAEKYSLDISNHSMFGCTVTKGGAMMRRNLGKAHQDGVDYVILEYGGNDCDFNWKEISENPNASHMPKTPLNVFTDTYIGIIQSLKEQGIRAALATLPPLEPERFFNWFCKGLNKENVLSWLGSINTIYRFHESYSRAVEWIARETGSMLIDIRGAFLKNMRIDDLLCEDGIHPNTKGQEQITSAFMDFAKNLSPAASLS